MLTLTTDKHEASRGLSATAELLVQRAIIAEQYGKLWRYTLFCSTVKYAET